MVWPHLHRARSLVLPCQRLFCFDVVIIFCINFLRIQDYRALGRSIDTIFPVLGLYHLRWHVAKNHKMKVNWQTKRSVCPVGEIRLCMQIVTFERIMDTQRNVAIYAAYTIKVFTFFLHFASVSPNINLFFYQTIYTTLALAETILSVKRPGTWSLYAGNRKVDCLSKHQQTGNKIWPADILFSCVTYNIQL